MNKLEKLKKKDIKEAAKVYQKGLSMEIPKGYCNLDKLIKVLDKEVLGYVYKIKNKIKGLVSFYFNGKDRIVIDFICALIQRKGIGTKLMKKLANLALKKKVRYIYSTVLTKDKKVMAFYKNCGFKKYKQYYAKKDFLLYGVKVKPIEMINAISKLK